MSTAWYCQVGGMVYGPMTGHDLNRMAKAGKLASTDPVRMGEGGQWLPAAAVRGLTFSSPITSVPSSAGREAPALPPLPHEAHPTKSWRLSWVPAGIATLLCVAGLGYWIKSAGTNPPPKTGPAAASHTRLLKETSDPSRGKNESEKTPVQTLDPLDVLEWQQCQSVPISILGESDLFLAARAEAEGNGLVLVIVKVRFPSRASGASGSLKVSEDVKLTIPEGKSFPLLAVDQEGNGRFLVGGQGVEPSSGSFEPMLLFPAPRQALEAGNVSLHYKDYPEIPLSAKVRKEPVKQPLVKEKESPQAIDERAWREACQTNTLQSFNGYLRDHPQGSHLEEARQAAEAWQWVDAQRENKIAAYQAYLDAYPEGRFAAEARARLKALRAAAPPAK